MWCQKFFPLLGGGYLCKIFFFQSEHVSRGVPSLRSGGRRGPSVKILFSSLNMYQAKSGVNNFSLYWGVLWVPPSPGPQMGSPEPEMGSPQALRCGTSQLDLRPGIPLDLRPGTPPDLRLGTPWTWDGGTPQTWDWVPPRPETRSPQTWDQVPPSPETGYPPQTWDQVPPTWTWDGVTPPDVNRLKLLPFPILWMVGGNNWECVQLFWCRVNMKG